MTFSVISLSLLYGMLPFSFGWFVPVENVRFMLHITL